MELKPGYKQTEVGVIPEDWDVAPLEREISSLDAGVSVNSVNEESQIFPHDQCILKTSSISGGVFYPDESKKIAPRDIERARLSPVSESIIISRMNTPDLVGECGYVSEDYPNLFLPDRLWMTQFKDIHGISVLWLNFLLSSKPYKVRIKGLATGTSGSMKNLAKDLFLAMEIPFPPYQEQTAIATALSDVDALLAGLDRLIAKKRAIKTAAMQQLLTGQTRLPGFDGEWEVKLLGDVLTMRHGRSQHEVVVTGGKYPILASGGEIGRTDSFLYDKPSVLIGRKGTIDEPQFISSPFWTVDTLFYTEMERGTDAKFVFYKFCMIPWRSYNEASGVPSINARTIENIEIRLPNIQEQTAITAILTDMDAEITALETRCVKTQSLKQGMMQELLTGRTRLL